MIFNYPRTYHLPWSPGCTSDDKKMGSVDYLLQAPLVITEKMDGSNVCLERDFCYGRTHNHAPTHSSFDMFKALHAGVKHLIPEHLQIFGEWCYARHSINYSDLASYLMLFGVRDKNTKEWLDWSRVRESAYDLGVVTVPVLEHGIIVNSISELKSITIQLGEQSSNLGSREGVVVRRQYRFDGECFPYYVGKYVRKDHVQTTNHWRHQPIIVNKLK